MGGNNRRERNHKHNNGYNWSRERTANQKKLAAQEAAILRQEKSPTSAERSRCRVDIYVPGFWGGQEQRTIKCTGDDCLLRRVQEGKVSNAVPRTGSFELCVRRKKEITEGNNGNQKK